MDEPREGRTWIEMSRLRMGGICRERSVKQTANDCSTDLMGGDLVYQHVMGWCHRSVTGQTGEHLCRFYIMMACVGYDTALQISPR